MKQKINVIMLSTAIVTDVVLNLIFIPFFGIVGAAFATSMGNFVCGIVFVVYFGRTTGIKPKDMIFMKKSDLANIANRRRL